jgi:hypothetical protein
MSVIILVLCFDCFWDLLDDIGFALTTTVVLDCVFFFSAMFQEVETFWQVDPIVGAMFWFWGQDSL